MAEHRSTAEEAADPGTSPERLLELTEKHPQLHRLIVMNPSAPEVARQWILATNQWAKQAYEAESAPSAEEAADEELDGGEPTQLHQAVPEEGEPTQLHQAVPDEGSAAGAREPAKGPSAPADQSEEAPEAAPDDSVSAWGDYPEELVWGTAAGATGAAAAGATAEAAQGAASRDAQAEATPPPAAPPPAPAQPASAAQSSPSQGSPSSSVRLSPKASVVPLGAAPAPQAGPATRPMAPVATSAAAGAGAGAGAGTGAGSGAASSQGPAAQQVPAGQQGDAGRQGPAAAPVPAGPLPGNDDDADDGSRKRTWLACGGCLVLALVLLAVIGLGARALLSPPEEDYQRDSSTTSAEAAPEETAPEETKEATSEDPVSPAPEGAEERNELLSPTGNISCLLEEDSVSCSVVDRDFSEEGLEDCADGPFSITVAGEDAERACGSSFLSDSAQALEYDSSAVRGDMACTSRFDGMTCWNTMTGKGFTVNKVSYETF